MNNILDLSSSLDFNNSNTIKGEIEIDDVFELENNIEILVQDKIIEPTREIQTVTADEDYDQLGTVTVNPIPDEYIIPDGTLDVDANGDVDVTMFRMARVGVYTPPVLQDKEVMPTREEQIIRYDEDYDGLNEVKVNPIPSEYIIPNGTLNITENGNKDVTHYTNVDVNIHPQLQSKKMTIYENQELNIVPDENFDALDKVNINLKVGTKVLWIVKDGIEQEENTGGSTFAFFEGESNRPGSKTQGDGYIALSARVWSNYRWKFNNNIDLTKYSRIYVEIDYPKTSSPYATSYSDCRIGLINSQFDTGLKTGTTMKNRTIIEVNISSHLNADQLYMAVINSGDGTSYTNYPFRIYNIWLEGEPATTEDLSDELSMQDEIITDQEISIEDIQKALVGKMVGRGPSGISNLNIFVQEGEPITKDGIWFKTSDLKYNKIKQLFITKPFQWGVLINDDKNLPYVAEAGVASVGTDLYIIGGITMYKIYRNQILKLDTLTATYKSITSKLPTGAHGIASISHGTDVYMFGGRTNNTCLKTIHKLDTINDTITQMCDLPETLGESGIAIVDDNIYIIAGLVNTSGTRSNSIYKYSISNNTCTKVAILPKTMNCPQVCSVGKNIYIFGGYNNTEGTMKSADKFNPLDNTVTQIADLPVGVFGGIAAQYRDKVYIAGGDTSDNDSMTDRTFLYDPYTDTYAEQEAKLWTNAGLGRFCGCAKIGPNIFAPGGKWNPAIGGGGGELSTITICKVEEELYSHVDTENCLLLPLHLKLNNNEITIQNTEDLSFNVLMTDCLHYSNTDGIDITTETYYGDGSEWIRIIR